MAPNPWILLYLSIKSGFVGSLATIPVTKDIFFILALSSISVNHGSNSCLSKIIAVSGKNKNSPSFELDTEVLKIFDLNHSVNSKKSFGGTSFDNIKKMLTRYKREIKWKKQ